jgi:transcriptional regulator with XRE-family HTH domain
METNFADWLQETLNEKGWSQAELARRSGISPAQITRVISGERGLGEQSIIALAAAFKLPAETVFRAAGLLPAEREKDPRDKEILHLFGLLADEEKQEILDYVRYRVERAEKKK